MDKGQEGPRPDTVTESRVGGLPSVGVGEGGEGAHTQSGQGWLEKENRFINYHLMSVYSHKSLFDL